MQSVVAQIKKINHSLQQNPPSKADFLLASQEIFHLTTNTIIKICL